MKIDINQINRNEALSPNRKNKWKNAERALRVKVHNDIQIAMKYETQFSRHGGRCMQAFSEGPISIGFHHGASKVLWWCRGEVFVMLW